VPSCIHQPNREKTPYSVVAGWRNALDYFADLSRLAKDDPLALGFSMAAARLCNRSGQRVKGFDGEYCVIACEDVSDLAVLAPRLADKSDVDRSGIRHKTDQVTGYDVCLGVHGATQA
jgi:hypothetical protein